MATLLIIGASRGIGLELARQYRGAGWRVLASVRKPGDRAALDALGAESFEYDVVTSATAILARTLEGVALDACIYNAGVAGPRLAKVEAPSAAEFDGVMQTNVLGALRAIPVVAPAVARAKGCLAFLSSRMGSIGQMESGNMVVYRASKAALNAVVKATLLEWGPQGVRVLALHPGWVRTDMGGAGASLDVETSVSGLRRVIENAPAQGPDHFIDYSGTLLAW